MLSPLLFDSHDRQAIFSIVILPLCLLECALLWLVYNANFFVDKKWYGAFFGLTLVQVSSSFSLHLAGCTSVFFID